MNAVVMRREARTPRPAVLHPRPRCGASRAASERGRGRSLVVIPEAPFDAPREARSPRLWWAAFWLAAVVAMVSLGFVIAVWLESGLLGFLGADFVFLIVMSVFMSGQSGAARRRG